MQISLMQLLLHHLDLSEAKATLVTEDTILVPAAQGWFLCPAMLQQVGVQPTRHRHCYSCPRVSACKQQSMLRVQGACAIISTFRNVSQEGKKGKPEIITHTSSH